MNLEDLGRRAAACKHWRWMPGMLLLWKLHKRGGTYEGRVCHLGDSDSGAGKDVYCEGRGDRFDGVLEVPKCFPDLSDPATLGCLLHLVREAWDHRSIVPLLMQSKWLSGDEWRMTIPGVCADTSCDGKSEAEALVAALETAP